ncbi:hypothetical protein ACIQPQ_31225 [Streptomyces sp. NPDC091281]|uniref:hypothetical protein n=1 Tax=Streptomyces sp. NPDC091281 TaxID=3365985 RepID=UPI00380C2011
MNPDDLAHDYDDPSLPEAVKAALQARDQRLSQGDYGYNVRSVISFRYDGPDENGFRHDIELAVFDGPLPIPAVGQRVDLWNTRPRQPFKVDRVAHWFDHSADEQVAITYVHLTVLDSD